MRASDFRLLAVAATAAAATGAAVAAAAAQPSSGVGDCITYIVVLASPCFPLLFELIML